MFHRQFPLAILAAVMLIGHVFFYVGFMVSDDSLYVAQAQQYLSGDFTPPTTHWGFRYTVVLPLTLLGSIVDYTEEALSLIPLAWWGGLILLVYFFTQQVLNTRAAFHSGLIVATLPLFVVQSSIVNVDITEAFLLFAAFVAFYFANESKQPAASHYFLSGVLVGLAMLTRETAYGFLLVLAIYFLFGGYKRWHLYLVGAAGILLVLSLEWVYYLSFDESPFYRLQTITQSHGSIGIKSGDFSAGTGNISDNRIVGPLLAILVNQEFALLYFAAIGSAIYLYRHGDEKNRKLLQYVAVTFGVYFLWIGYSGAIRPLPRYYSFLSVLATIPIAIMLHQLDRDWVRYVILIIIIGANIAALSVENIHPRFASRTVSEYTIASDMRIVVNSQTARRTRDYLKLAAEDDSRLTSEIPNHGSFIYVQVDGFTPPETLREYLVERNLEIEMHPPKPLVGRLLDVSGIGSMLPDHIYRYLAIRNPTVRFYRVTLDA